MLPVRIERSRDDPHRQDFSHDDDRRHQRHLRRAWFSQQLAGVDAQE
jgi:hypothetical protein